MVDSVINAESSDDDYNISFIGMIIFVISHAVLAIVVWMLAVKVTVRAKPKPGKFSIREQISVTISKEGEESKRKKAKKQKKKQKKADVL